MSFSYSTALPEDHWILHYGREKPVTWDKLHEEQSRLSSAPSQTFKSSKKAPFSHADASHGKIPFIGDIVYDPAADGSIQFVKRQSFKGFIGSSKDSIKVHHSFEDVDRPYNVGNLLFLADSESQAFVHEDVSNHSIKGIIQPGQIQLNQSKSRLKNLRRKVTHAARWLIGDILGTGYSDRPHENSKYKLTHRSWMVTLTYRDGVDWHASDIKRYLNNMNSWAKTKGFKLRYVWVAEVQEKRRLRDGSHAIHYHIIFWIPKGLNVPKADKRGWWLQGSTNTLLSKSPVGYLLKYASKGSKEGCAFIKGMRTHGSGGFFPNTKQLLSFSHKPQYVKDHYQSYEARPVRVKGGGWVSRVTGDFLDSLYECISISPLIVRLKEGYQGVKSTLRHAVPEHSKESLTRAVNFDVNRQFCPF